MCFIFVTMLIVLNYFHKIDASYEVVIGAYHTDEFLCRETRNNKTLAQAEGLQQIFSMSAFFIPFNYF